MFNFKAMPQPNFDKVFRPQLKHARTAPKPFSFNDKDKERWQKKEEKIQDIYKEEERVRDFICLSLKVVISLPSLVYNFNVCSFSNCLVARIQSSTTALGFSRSPASCVVKMWHKFQTICTQYREQRSEKGWEMDTKGQCTSSCAKERPLQL